MPKMHLQPRFRPGPTGGVQRSPDCQTGFKGPTSKGGKGRAGEGRERKEREGEGKGSCQYFFFPTSSPD